MRYRRLALSLGLCLAVACGDDDDDDDKKIAATTGGDGGTTGPVNPEAPGITAKDCPGAATDVTLLKVAPVWGGLIGVEATIPGGVPTYLDVGVFDPSMNLWQQSYGGLFQRPDGKYLLTMEPPVRESNKAAERKIRVRPRLDGCPTTPWAETPGFTLGDPLTGTTWRADIPLPSFGDRTVYVNKSAGAGTTVGPYTLDAPVSHQITFNADGTLEEKYSFGIASQNAGDLYAGCKFVLTYVGTWAYDFAGGNTPQLQLSGRKPKRPGAAAGSTCTTPPIAELEIEQATGGWTQSAQTYSLNVDYTPLLENPPGKPQWTGSQLAAGFNNMLQNVSDVVGADQANVSGSAYPSYVRHIKQ